MKNRLLLCVSLLLPLAAHAQSPTPATATATATATAHCGLRELTYKDPGSGAATQLLVFYPTATAERTVQRERYTLSIAPDAPPLSGRLPLVLLSHGTGGTALGHHDSAAYLARHGFIVAALLHAGNNHFDDKLAGTPQNFQVRPRAVSAALDAVIADAKLGSHVDVGRVGALGYSAGGYTVLVAGGAVADLSLIPTHCAAHAAEDVEFCSYLHGRKPAPAGPPVLVRAADRRIRAVAALAPAGVPFDKDGLAGLTGPLRVYRAEKDQVLCQPFHAEHVHQLAPKAEYVVVPNAGHYAFLAPFPATLASRLGPIASDPPGFDRVAFHERLNGELAQFFTRALAPNAK
jgi:predicted dienelactone hydrolase